MDKFKKVVCIIGVVILVSLYLLSLISAIFFKEGSQSIFMAAVYSTVVVPVMMYAMLLMYKVFKNHKDE